jgi:hypothetical protein
MRRFGSAIGIFLAFLCSFFERVSSEHFPLCNEDFIFFLFIVFLFL